MSDQQHKSTPADVGTALIGKTRIKAKGVNCPSKQRSRSVYTKGAPGGENRCLLVDSESLTSTSTAQRSSPKDNSQISKDLSELLSLPTPALCSKKTKRPSISSIGSSLYNMWKIKRSVSFTAPKRTATVEAEQRQNQFNATQLWDALVSHLEQNVNPGRRRRSFRWYENCFQGSEAIDCLKHFVEGVLERNVERHQVFILLSRFTSWGVIEPVTSPDKNTSFKDSGLYRLTRQHFWRQDEREKTNSLRRSTSIPSMVAGGDTEDSGVATSSSSHSDELVTTEQAVSVETGAQVCTKQVPIGPSMEVPLRGGVAHHNDNGHKRYSELRAHKVLSKEQQIQKRKTCHLGDKSLLQTRSLSSSCGDLADKGFGDQEKGKEDHTHQTHPVNLTHRTHPVAQSGCHDNIIHKKVRHHSSKMEHSTVDPAHRKPRHTSSKDGHRKSSISKRAYCDLYKKIANSGQFDKSPVAYGDFGALAMKDVLWQHFSCSQDSGFSIFTSELTQLNPMDRMESLSQVQVVRYGFV